METQKFDKQVVKAKVEKYLSKQLADTQMEAIDVIELSFSYNILFKISELYLIPFDLIDAGCRVGLVNFFDKTIRLYIDKSIIDDVEL